MEAREMLAENVQGRMFQDEVANVLQQKWNPLLEGIQDRWTRRFMARLYENQMNHLQEETRKSPLLTEATAMSAVPDYVKFVFPLVRRVWANLIANGLVSIQPMNAPIGGVFFWEYKYGTTKGTITAGDNMIENFDPNYSSERVYNELLGTGTGGVANYTGNLSWTPVKPWDSFGTVGAEFTSVCGGTAKTISDTTGSGPIVTLTGDIGAASTLTYSNGAYDITFDANVDSGVPVYANYFFSMEAASASVPEVNVDITLQPVQAWSRKIKTLWSAESADDLRAMLGMDIESELVGGTASEMQLEIDREIITDLKDAAAAGTNKATFDAAVPAGRSPIEHYSGILTYCDKLSQQIHTDTKRGGGNFIVCAPDVKTVFSALSRHGDFKGVYNPGAGATAPGVGTGGRPGFPLPAGPQGYGIFEAGTLQDRWRVFVDPYMASGKAVIGLKGTTFLDAGYVYAPYVPMQVTSTFLDPDNFQARKGIRTRYATKLTNTKFYGELSVTNTP